MTDQEPFLKFDRGKSPHRFDLQVTTLSMVRSQFVDGQKPPLIKHAFFVLFHVTKGQGTYQVDFDSHELEKGDTLFLGKGQVHIMGDEPEMEGIMVLFTAGFLEKNNAYIGESPLFNSQLHAPVLRKSETGTPLTKSFYSLWEEFQQGDSQNLEKVLRNCLENIILKAEDSPHYSPNPTIDVRYHREFAKFKQAVEDNFRQTRNVKDIAQIMGRSRKKVNDLCRMFTPYSAKEFIDRRAILEMKRTLATQDISIKELTWEMGFEEPTNLVKFFKRHTGMTPGHFLSK